MDRRVTIIAACVLMGLFWLRIMGGQQNARELEGMLSSITHLELEAADLPTAIQRFAKQLGLPIGFEALPSTAGSRTARSISLHLEAESVKSALDQLIRIDGRYQWAVDDAVVDVSPTGFKDPLLETVIDKFEVHELDKYAALESLVNSPQVKSLFAAQRVRFHTPRSIVGGLPTNEPTITLTLKNATTRRILNAMMLQVGSHFWIFYRYGDQNQYVAIDM